MGNNEDFEEEMMQTSSILARRLVITEREDADGERAEPFFLAGKVLASTPVGAKTIWDVFRSIWKCRKSWRVKELEPGLFQFSFDDGDDLRRVMGGRPWKLRGAQLVLKEWPAHMLAGELDFSTTPFWVRLCGLPPGFHNIASARELAPLIGVFLGFSGRAGNDLKMRVEVNIQKALCAGFFLDRDELSPLWVQCKFENLGRVCYTCGILGHSSDSCSARREAVVRAPHSPEVKLYGGWIHEENSSRCALPASKSSWGKGSSRRRWRGSRKIKDPFQRSNSVGG